MDSVDFSVFTTALEWARKKQPLWLMTVVETFGSSPRPIGAMLVLRVDGLMVGSVSGGCIEDDLADKARLGQLPQHKAELLTYGVTTEEARRFGLPCGGVLKVLAEPIHDHRWLQQILSLVAEHRLVSRTLVLETLNVVVNDATPDNRLQLSATHLTTVHGPRWRMLIIGAGQTSVYLAQMAQALDYEVIVCDPREEFRQTWSVPGTHIIGDMPDDAILSQQVDSRTAVIALTHDPKLDDMALLEALKSPAFYVGALGSHRTNQHRRERLAMFDLTPEEIDRLHGPVGLSIGSRTPPEIAVAIVAHLVSIRNHPQFNAASFQQTEFKQHA
ncbi:XdhC family protein [Methylovorus mays]|uniref:XdhC family protein n=1 Tax=Methylovorus mays TaxID=184077 RepID=UPI001E646CAC|nr:XdhC family protein [Methylovorus mays]MCB5206321.1 XdhC family protein [Methylovorus mays]